MSGVGATGASSVSPHHGAVDYVFRDEVRLLRDSSGLKDGLQHGTYTHLTTTLIALTSLIS